MSKDSVRIAWLVPISEFYWQHALSELANIFPDTKLFTANWPGYARGYENKLNYEVVGSVKVLDNSHLSDLGYSEFIKLVSFKIIWTLLRYRPDVVFSVTFGLWTILSLLIKPIGKWKVVISYEGSSPRVDYRNSPLRLSLRRVMVRAADACITNTEAGKEYLVNVLNAPPERVFVSPHEVPSAKSISLSNKASYIRKVNLENIKFIFVGKVIARKGLIHLLESVKLLLGRGIHNFEIVIVGDGEERRNLESYCDSSGLNSHVLWMGRVDYSQLGEVLAESDVFVFPTLEDTWGMVVLEAMLLAKPILCSKYAGSSELIIDGENGYCFDPHNIDELARLMEIFISNPEGVIRLGEAAREYISIHNPEKAAVRLANIISSLMNKTSSSFTLVNRL
jgi:glycosyltransferase involved in cell wall biosynthesis